MPDLERLSFVLVLFFDSSLVNTWGGLKGSAQHRSYSSACSVYALCFLTFVGKKKEARALI